MIEGENPMEDPNQENKEAGFVNEMRSPQNVNLETLDPTKLQSNQETIVLSSGRDKQ